MPARTRCSGSGCYESMAAFHCATAARPPNCCTALNCFTAESLGGHFGGLLLLRPLVAGRRLCPGRYVAKLASDSAASPA